MANESAREPQPHTGISSGAKVGVAIAAGSGIVLLFTMGSWLWWRRRQKRQLAKDMINFVDGDIVNLVDGGRFEKRTDKPSNAYDPYFPTSSQSTTPSPVYQHSQPASVYQQSTTSSLHHHSTPSPVYPQLPTPDPHAGYYVPTPPREDVHPSIPYGVVPPPPVSTADSNAWANAGRHPWSPPDYDAHSPDDYDTAQAEHDASSNPRPSTHDDSKGAYPVEALPAILPDMRPQPHAELPAREGHYGWGHEQELPAPSQAPLRRQGPPQGNELDEQKFLVADIMSIRQQKTRRSGTDPEG